MSSREKILSAVLDFQPAEKKFTDDKFVQDDSGDNAGLFIRVLQSIGGTSYEVHSWEQLTEHIKVKFEGDKRMISAVSQVNLNHGADWMKEGPHNLEDIEVAVINGHFGVAENASIWITEDLVYHRVLPFICQHLVIVINKSDIVCNMHEAYSKIGESYHFGTFIGPLKNCRY